MAKGILQSKTRQKGTWSKKLQILDCVICVSGFILYEESAGKAESDGIQVSALGYQQYDKDVI